MNSQPTFLFLTYLKLKFVSAIMVRYFLSNFFVLEIYSMFCNFLLSSLHSPISKGQMEVE